MLAAVVAALIYDKLRADVVALTGAAFLLMTGVVRPVEVQSAFASPAIIALASLFVIAYAMELAGLLMRPFGARDSSASTSELQASGCSSASRERRRPFSTIRPSWCSAPRS